MKKILMALGIIAVAYTGAEAQQKCGREDKHVCRQRSDGNTVSCYETKYAQNYKVCKGDKGYYVCCGANNEAADDGNGMMTRTTYNAYEAAFPEDNRPAGERTSVTTTVVTTHAVAAENDGDVTTTITTKEEKMACGENEKQVCRKDANGNKQCYKTDYAQNFKVCKGSNGYYICCDPPQVIHSKYMYPPRM